MLRLIAHLLGAALLLGACTDGGPAETTGPPTLPSPPHEVDACDLLSLAEAEELIGDEMAATGRPGVCNYAGPGPGGVLIEVISAPNGAADLADQRRIVEDAVGPINVMDVAGLGPAAFRVQAGGGFQIRFAVDTVVVTLAVTSEDSSAGFIDRAEEMARTIAGRF